MSQNAAGHRVGGVSVCSKKRRPARLTPTSGKNVDFTGLKDPANPWVKATSSGVMEHLLERKNITIHINYNITSVR